jgi:hypothetical protein
VAAEACGQDCHDHSRSPAHQHWFVGAVGVERSLEGGRYLTYREGSPEIRFESLGRKYVRVAIREVQKHQH